MSILFPDYENCSVNVIHSIASACGMQPFHKTHPFVDALLQKKKYKNIILMLFDGMGVDLIERTLPEDAFLRKHMAHHLSAVFPSTTTCATTAIECGQMPCEHAWLGWTLRFEQIGKSVDVYTNQDADNGTQAADYYVGERFIPRDFIYPHINAAGQYRATSVSAFGHIRIKKLPELFENTLALAMDDQNRYIYTYWHEPDSTMHRHGCYHPKSIAQLVDINDRVEKLAQQLPEDSLLLLTADHGLIDADIRYLEDYPDLMEMLRWDATMELRALSFHVKEEYISLFPSVFQRHFGSHFMLLSHEDFIEKFLGPGKCRSDVHQFVGDYVAISLDEMTLMNHRPNFLQIGHHAGLTAQEMLVPLIVVEK